MPIDLVRTGTNAAFDHVSIATLIHASKKSRECELHSQGLETIEFTNAVARREFKARKSLRSRGAYVAAYISVRVFFVLGRASWHLSQPRTSIRQQLPSVPSLAFA